MGAAGRWFESSRPDQLSEHTARWANAFVIDQTFRVARLRSLVRLALALACLVAGLSTGHARAASVAEAIEGRLAEQAARNVAWHEVLHQAYRARAFAPIWVDADRAGARARELAAIIARAVEEGLDPRDYAPAAIARLMRAKTVPELAALDVVLTRTLIAYVADLAEGREAPRAADPALFAYSREFDPRAIVERAAAAADLAAHLGTYSPANPYYRRLRMALARYRALAAAGGWPRVAPDETIRPGDIGPQVRQLRRRLLVEGENTLIDTDEPIYDEGLELAVRRFQHRHGLAVDGVVGRQTLAALNVPLAARLKAIELNMERWRWTAERLGDAYVLVNLAGFELEVVEHGAVALSMRVVVGRAYRKSPVFSDEIEYLDINPYWNVPPSIARNDLLPKVIADPGYFEKIRIRVFSDWSAEATELDSKAIPWARYAGGAVPFKLRQDPGPQNTLGRIKFMFPNAFDVYLHDSPGREQFSKTVRTFSSGCIRLERPLALAAFLLGGAAAGWSESRLQALVDSGERRVITLAKKVPVHLTYQTAWVGEGGAVHFRDDVYGRDAALAAALRARR